MIPWLDVMAILSIGPLVGTEFAVAAFINPVLWRLEEQPQMQAIALFARKLGTVMPFWYGVSFLLLLAETVVRRHQAGFTLLVAASAIWAAVIVLTLLFLVPINNRMARLAGSEFAASSRREHRQWDARHRIRVAALVVAMLCALIALRG